MKYVLICTIFKRSPKKMKKTWIESTRPKQMLRRPIAAITTRVRCSIFLKKNKYFIQIETWRSKDWWLSDERVIYVEDKLQFTVALGKNVGWKLNEKRNQSSVCCNHPGPRDNCCPSTCPPSDGLWKLNIHFMNHFLVVLATFKNLPVERVPSQKENCWDFMCVFD